MSLQFLKEELNKLIDKNERYSKWEIKLVKKINSGNFISVKLFEKINQTPLDWDSIWVFTPISNFTLNNDANKFEYNLNQAKYVGVIKSFEKKKLGYKLIAQDDTQIRFLKLIDFVPQMDESIKQELQSEDRLGHCHWRSINLSRKLQAPNMVVSGFCSVYSKKMLFSHSWIELEHQGKEWVLDYTMGVAMNKEGYYKLLNPQNVVKIDNKTLVKDIALRKRTSFDGEDIRMYLFYPNETRELMEEECKQYKTYETGEYPWLLVEK